MKQYIKIESITAHLTGNGGKGRFHATNGVNPRPVGNINTKLSKGKLVCTNIQVSGAGRVDIVFDHLQLYIKDQVKEFTFKEEVDGYQLTITLKIAWVGGCEILVEAKKK
jgi:hypothetical protein